MLVCADRLHASTKNSQIYKLRLKHPSEILSAIRKRESLQRVLMLENAVTYFVDGYKWSTFKTYEIVLKMQDFSVQIDLQSLESQYLLVLSSENLVITDSSLNEDLVCLL